MRIPISLIAISTFGLPTGACAQTIATVSLITSHTEVAPGDTFTIGVILSDNIAGNSVWGFDITVTGTFGVDYSTSEPTPSPRLEFFNGFTNPTGAHGRGNADLLFPFDPSLDGVAVYTFEATVSESAQVGDRIDFVPMDGAHPSAAVLWGLVPGPVIFPQEYDDIQFFGVPVLIVPTPGTAPMLLFIALAARRQR